MMGDAAWRFVVCVTCLVFLGLLARFWLVFLGLLARFMEPSIQVE
jgi:hypothetical protein